MDNIKVVYIENCISSTPKQKPDKCPKKRVVTSTNKWTFSAFDLTPASQMEYITKIHSNFASTENTILGEPQCKFIIQQINQKLYGYRYQDAHKNLFQEQLFIDLKSVIDLLLECNNQCFYCKEPVQVLYEQVREPKQWTLDRLNNHAGHNKSNVVIACLICNLRRKTMYHERYVFTKQMNIVKTA